MSHTLVDIQSFNKYVNQSVIGQGEIFFFLIKLKKILYSFLFFINIFPSSQLFQLIFFFFLV